MRAIVAFIRCWGGLELVGAAALVPLAAHTIPLGPVRVPGQADVRTVVWPLVPVLASLAVPIGASFAYREWTWLGPRHPSTARASFVFITIVRGMAVVALAPIDRLVVARNLAFFDGIALASLLVRRRPSWTALILMPVGCWLLGVAPPDHVQTWAIPLRDPYDSAAGAIAVGAWLLAASLYVLTPGWDADS